MVEKGGGGGAPARQDFERGASLAPRAPTSLLDRPALALLRLNWEVLLYAAIIVLAALLRFWDLGTRILHHDESIHAVYSWYLLTGRGYVHNPTYHGPLLYDATALMYFLFGDSDYTARLAPALFGTIMVGLPCLLRRQLGRTGALVTAFLLAVSPSILYYSRSLRHDIFAAAATLAMVIALWRYVDDRRPRWLYLAAVGLVVGFTTHELTFMTVFIVVLFAVAIAWPSLLDAARRRNAGALSPFAEYLFFIATLTAPLFTAVVIEAQRRLNPDAPPPGIGELTPVVAVTFVGLFLLAMALGVWWNRPVWTTGALIFYITFALLYTAFLSNPNGFFTGAIGSLQYWLTQHDVKRGGQPWFYYLLLLPLYEFLPLLFGLGAVVYSAVRHRLFGLFLLGLAVLSAGLYRLLGESTPWLVLLIAAPFVALTGLAGGVRRDQQFQLFLAFWALLSLVLYSWAGEKMPWLLIHITLPVVLIAGTAIGRLADTVDWQALRERGGGILGLWYILALVVLAALWHRGWPFAAGRSPLDSQRLLVESLALLTILAALTVLAWQGARRLRYGAGHVFAFVLLALALPFSLRAAWEVNFYNGDVPVEMLVYTQSSPDVGKVMREVERIGFRTGTGKEVKVAYDDNVSWPFEWYLRDYKGRNFFGNGMPASDAPIILVGLDNEHDARVKPTLGNRYVGQRYKLRWWFPEDYRGLTADSIRAFLFDGTTRGRIWRYFLYRETLSPLGSTDFMLYERKDLVGGSWSITSGVAQAGTPEEDQYAKATREVTAVEVWGTAGGGDGQFAEPKNLALGPDGSVYVADSKNHRVQKFDQNGRFLTAWGGNGKGEGQFVEPWGIAVAADGTVFVADTWNHRIQKFDHDGRFLGQWGKFANSSERPAGEGDFFGPRGIAIDGEGNLYVTDTGNHRVEKFDQNGRFLAAYGTRGSGDGQFNEPVGIAFDREGFVYIADTWNRRVQKLDRDFRPLAQWPVAGWLSESPLNKPYIAVDRAGSVYASDPENHRIVKFSGTGTVLAVWGKLGADPSSLRAPTGIAADASGNIFVADSQNNRVLKFGPVP